MSLKLGGIVTTLVAVALALSLLPTVAYAGGYHRHRHYHRHYYGHPHHHRHGVHLWFNLQAYPGGWPTPPAARGEYRVWVPSVELIQPERREIPSLRQKAQHCREFQREIIIDGKPEQAYGTACLQPDGSWKIVP